MAEKEREKEKENSQWILELVKNWISNFVLHKNEIFLVGFYSFRKNDITIPVFCLSNGLTLIKSAADDQTTGYDRMVFKAHS